MFLTEADPPLHVVSFGRGPTVLLLPGWSSSWEFWEPTLTELTRDARCIVPDTRGTGWSAAGEGPVTLGDLVHDVFRVLDAHGVSECVIVGGSLGGLVALHAVARHPSRFRGVCVVGTPLRFEARTIHAVVEGSLADYPQTIRTFVRTCLPEVTADEVLAWADELFLTTRPVTAAQLMAAVGGGPVPEVTGLGVPAVVVHGIEDQVVPIADAHEMVAALPGARLVTLDGAGHLPSITRPRSVADAVRSLL